MLGNLSPVGRKLPYHVPCWFSSGVARRGSSGAGFGQGVGLRYLPTILVCWLSDAFVTRFSYLWQTKGHTLIQC